MKRLHEMDSIGLPINYTQIKHEHPQAYVLSMNILLVIGTFINVSTFLVILWVSPESMQRYKKHLLWYQFWSICLELLLHGILAELYFPGIAARSHGFLSWISLKVLFQAGAAFVIAMVMATAQCLLYRHRQILPTDHWFRFTRRTWTWIAIVHYTLPSILLDACAQTILTTAGTDVNSVGVKRLLEAFPEYGFITEDPQVLVGEFTALYPPYIQLTSVEGICIVVIILIVEILTLAFATFFHSMYLLNGHNKMMSERTRRLQKKLLFALMLQIFVPFLTVAGPWGLYAYIVSTHTVMPQELVNMAFLIDSCHATASSISIWVFTEPYRRFFLERFGKLTGLVGRTPVIHSISQSQVNKNS